MQKADLADLVGGAVVLLIGAFFAWGALDYRVGSAARMGPGFVPLSLGIIAMILGAAIMLTSLRRQGRIEPFRPMVVLPILASILAFALILPRAGLIPAILASVLLSSLASPKSRLPVTLLTAAVVAFLIWVAFIQLLGLTIPVLRNPF